MHLGQHIIVVCRDAFGPEAGLRLFQEIQHRTFGARLFTRETPDALTHHLGLGQTGVKRQTRQQLAVVGGQIYLGGFTHGLSGVGLRLRHTCTIDTFVHVHHARRPMPSWPSQVGGNRNRLLFIVSPQKKQPRWVTQSRRSFYWPLLRARSST